MQASGALLCEQVLHHRPGFVLMPQAIGDRFAEGFAGEHGQPGQAPGHRPLPHTGRQAHRRLFQQTACAQDQRTHLLVGQQQVAVVQVAVGESQPLAQPLRRVSAIFDQAQQRAHGVGNDVGGAAVIGRRRTRVADLGDGLAAGDGRARTRHAQQCSAERSRSPRCQRAVQPITPQCSACHVAVQAGRSRTSCMRCVLATMRPQPLGRTLAQVMTCRSSQQLPARQTINPATDACACCRAHPRRR